MKRVSIVAAVVAAGLGAAALGVTHFATHRSGVTRSLVYVKRSAHDSTIWRANLDGTHPARLVSGINPQISPNERLVAYFRNTKTRDVFLHGGKDSTANGVTAVPTGASVFVIPASGGTAKPVTEAAAAYPNLVWASDSRQLAIDSGKGLYVFNSITGSGKLVARKGGPYPSYSPSFSPDSKSLVYEVSDWSTDDLYITDLKSGRRRQLTRLGDASSPVWGPRRIAFVHRRGVWLIDESGEHLFRLVDRRSLTEGMATSPLAWSSDGRRLLVSIASFRPDSRFKAIDVPGGEVRFSGVGYPLGLSRDGNRALIDSCIGPSVSGSIDAIPLVGGKPRTIVKDACSASWNA